MFFCFSEIFKIFWKNVHTRNVQS